MLAMISCTISCPKWHVIINFDQTTAEMPLDINNWKALTEYFEAYN